MSEINRRLEEALVGLAEQYERDVKRLAEHFERAMTRQAEDNEQLAAQVGSRRAVAQVVAAFREYIRQRMRGRGVSFER